MTDLQNIYQGSNQLGEAAIWHVATRRMLWIDLLKPRLFALDPATGVTTVLEVKLAGPLGAIVPTSNPRIVMVSHLHGLSTLDLETGATTPFADPERGRDAIIYNDCKTDRFGRLWVGTSHYKEQEARGALWCVLPNGEAYLGDTGFAVSNGPAFSLDGKIMYFNDSAGRKTFAYDISADDPRPRNRRVFASYAEEEGMPDGVVVDEEDYLWVAHWGGARVTRISPKGERQLFLNVPAPHVTTIGFGGDDMRSLYITTARDGLSEEKLKAWPQSGDLFLAKTDVAGIPEPLFKLD
jgi:D-xylonolactonase